MQFIQIVVLIACSIVFVIVVRDARTLSRILRNWREWPKLENKFVAESLIDLKSNQKLFSSLGFVMITLLAFFGYDKYRGIEATIDALKMRVHDVDSSAQRVKETLSKNPFYNNRPFVVDSLHVDGKTRRGYSDLRVVGPNPLPAKFETAPIVLISAARGLEGESVGTDIRGTTEFLEIECAIYPVILTLWLYIK